MASYEPHDDPSEAPTGKYGYGQQPGGPGPAATPWHRKPAAVVGLGVLVAVLLALVILGIVELTREGGSSPSSTSATTPAPATTSSTAPTPSSLSPSSTTSTESLAPAPTTNLSTAPTSSTPTSTSIDEGHHHHHHHDGGTP